MKVKSFIGLVMSMAVVLSSTSAFSEEFPFKGGEKTVYTIHYKLGFSADIATLEVNVDEGLENGKQCFHVVSNLKTFKFGDTFYRIRDLYEAKFYASANLQPIMYHRDVSEGNYWSKNWYNWNEDASKVEMKIEKSTRPKREEVLDCPPIMRDLINVIFRLRSVDYDRLLRGEKVHYEMIVDRQINDVYIRMDGRETKKVSSEAGTFNTVKLAIADIIRKDPGEETASKVTIDSPQEKIFFWVTDDENRLPVFFSAPVALGSMNGRMSSSEGLKYPLKSKVK